MAYIGVSPVVGEFKKLDDISSQFNDSNTTFNLTVGGSATPAGSAQNLLISIDGVIQEPQAAYTVGGSTISFTEAPNTASTFFGIQLGSVAQVGTVSDGSITTEKIGNDSITNAKLNLTYSSSEFLANGSGNVFTINSGHDANSVLVFVNGICMLPVADYGVTGTTLTFTYMPVANSNVSIRYLPV